MAREREALFLELACIRWAGSHVLRLAYVSNLLLITAFLGVGLGTSLAEKTPLTAYSVDIAGSLFGIVLFSLASWFGCKVT